MSHRLFVFFLLAMLSLSLASCESQRRDDDDTTDDDDDDDSATSDDDDDDGAPSAVDGDGVTEEDGDCNDDDPSIFPGADEICDDSIDNDCDTLSDCDDSDCDGADACLPDTLQHDAALVFTGTFPGVADCVTAFNATINAESSDSGECPECDRIYAGPLNYTEDTCSSAFDTEPPSANRYGIAFTDSATLEVFGMDADTGVWSSLGNAPLQTDGWFVLTRTDGVDIDPIGQVGSLSTTLKFLIP